MGPPRLIRGGPCLLILTETQRSCDTEMTLDNGTRIDHNTFCALIYMANVVQSRTRVPHQQSAKSAVTDRSTANTFT